MQSLGNLECFVRSAQTLSFSEAARQLSLTPAAVSRNVAMLERSLGVRLFHRSTRTLTMTEAGEQLLQGIGANLDGLSRALKDAQAADEKPSGTLRVSMPVTFGVRYIVPLLATFLRKYPAIRIDFHFDNRPVDLISERFDVAIGAGFELTDGMTVRRLAPFHLVAVAAPGFLSGGALPSRPKELENLDGIVVRSSATGKIRLWSMQDDHGTSEIASLRPTIVFNDPLPVANAAVNGLGVAILAVADVLPHLEDGSLVRVLPAWHASLGDISLYHASSSMLPRKARAFSDFVVDHLRSHGLAKSLAGSS